MIYGRINLKLSNYISLESAKFLSNPDYEQLKKIYYEYCDYKKFTSIMPFFEDDYKLLNRDLIGYYENDVLVAYTLIVKYPTQRCVISDQFAWNYKNPRLQLGIKSIEHECFIYRNLGYKYLYLGEHAAYKSKFTGYEIVGRNLQDTTSS
jgi:hypothetical protein